MTATVKEQYRGLQPLEGLCCAARCERLSEHEVEVQIGGRTSQVRMCPEHAAHHPRVPNVHALH